MTNKDIKELYFRGEARDYKETSLMPSIQRLLINEYSKEVNSIYLEKEYYDNVESVCNGLKIIDIENKNSDLDNKKETTLINYAKKIGIFQHNGFCTRFLDITTNPLVALYFASQQYGEDGFFFIFDTRKETNHENTKIKHIKDTRAKTIIRKMEIIKIASNDEKIIFKNDLFKEDNINEIKSDTIEDNIVLDYKNVLGIKSENIRYDNQSGKFILFGNQIKDDRVLPEFTTLKETMKYKIPKDKKMDILINICFNEYENLITNLPIMQNFISKETMNHIYNVYLFPDTDKSLSLKTKYLSIKTIYEINKDKAEQIYRDYVKDVFNNIIDSSIIKAIEQLFYKIINNDILFYFIFTEYLNYVIYLNEVNKKGNELQINLEIEQEPLIEIINRLNKVA